MITAILSGNGRIDKTILATNLAAWCARRRRKVLILDAGTQKHGFLWCLRRRLADAPLRLSVEPVIDTSLFTELEQLSAGCQEVVIDTDGCDDTDTRTALIAASTAVVPLCTQPRDEQAEAALVELLARAQLFNPALRVVVVVIQGQDAGAVGAMAAAHALANRIGSASVAPVVIHDTADARTAFQEGLTVYEAGSAGSQAVTEAEALGSAVFGTVEAPSGMAAEIKAAIAKLRTWRHGSRVHLHLWMHRHVR